MQFNTLSNVKYANMEFNMEVKKISTSQLTFKKLSF